MSPTVDLALELIARKSLTPEDGGCQQSMAARLAALGFRIEQLRYGNVENLWAVRGQGAPTLCFAGHTDVVPTGPLDEWRSDPFVPEIRADVLYGRGAADMKTGLAAMITATEAYIGERAQHQGTIAFLITSDEEGPSIDGTKKVVETLMARGTAIDWCIVGEPSSERRSGDVVKIGRRGSLSGQLTVHGVQGHIAYPQLAENPVHRFAPALAELAAREWDQGNEHFQPTSFQVSNLNAGTGAPNVIPGELRARFNLRYSPVQSIAGLKAVVEGILARHRLRYTLDWYDSGEPFYTRQGRLLAGVSAAVRKVCGQEPALSTSGGTSDGRFIARMGAEVVELGVPNPTIHKVDECVRLADIDALHALYLEALRQLLG
ncbi:MAG: succinyl-diaminopimelate desuccinylase [Gammaproteobacteria bacterium]|nr:succinyl-diaminopimelate desuccinylase [Gammaproteobacteria bacterium]MDE2250010.1 succinyl-diaminopimelate desuccinylase [Gammaproteobacteria bacterium]